MATRKTPAAQSAAKEEKITGATGAVVAAKSGALAVPDFMDEADYGSGFEGADKDSYAIPFIQILQKMSPLVDEDNAKHVEGAKAGMLYNTVTKQLYDGKTGLIIIPCAFKRSYILWGARDGDGGFKGEFEPETVDRLLEEGKIKNVEGKLLVPDAEGNTNEKKSDYYADTRSHYVITIDAATGETTQAILSLSSSQIKASKALMTTLQQRKVQTPSGRKTLPAYMNMVRLTTISMANEKGNWSGANFAIEGIVGDKELYEMAKEFRTAVLAGDLKADYSKAADAGDSSVSSTPENTETF